MRINLLDIMTKKVTLQHARNRFLRELEILKKGIDRLKANKEFSIIETNYDVKGYIEVQIEYDKKRYNHKETIAGMYAAKEAFLKAMKKGIHQCSLLDIEKLFQDLLFLIKWYNND
mgnify:CR=1 FL=1